MKVPIHSVLLRRRVTLVRKKGQTLAEYALVMAVLSIVAVAIYGMLDTQIYSLFSGIANILDTAQSSH